MLWVWIEKSISSQIIHHKSRLLSIFGIKANLFRSKPHNLQWKLRSMILPSKITSTHSYINIIIVCVEWKFNLLACGLDSGCNMCARHIHTHTHRITHEHNSGVAAAIKHILIHDCRWPSPTAAGYCSHRREHICTAAVVASAANASKNNQMHRFEVGQTKTCTISI